MATAATERLENLLECPICLKKVTEPLAFDCHHFYCQPCINDLPIKQDKGISGYDCPMCRQFTAKDKLKTIHFLHELLDILELSKKGQHQTCSMCSKVEAQFKCIDCKDVFCSECKKDHDRVPVLKNHEWEPIGDGSAQLVDRHIYCTKHPKEIVKFNCKECEKLICIICNGTQHKQHTAETIEEAVERVLETVKKQKMEVEKKMKQNKKTLNKANQDLKDLEDKYGDVEKEIDEQCEKVLKKITEDRRKLKEQLQQKKNEQIGDIKEWIGRNQQTLKHTEHIIALSDATIAGTQNASLLQALQSNVGKGLQIQLDQALEKPDYDAKMKVRFVIAQPQTENAIGTLSVYFPKARRPLSIDRPLSELRYKTLKHNKTTYINFLFARFTKTDDELWCVEYNTNKVHCLDMDHQNHKTIEIDGVNVCRSVLKMKHGLILATSSGLYQAQLDGSNSQLIVSGYMTDMSWIGSTGYVLDDGSGIVHVVQLDEITQNVTKESEIVLSKYNKETRNTIQVTTGFIAVSQVSEGCVRKYTHQGVLISTHGSKGEAEGQLRIPWLCGADVCGALLVAEESNRRFQVLEPNGDWFAFKVPITDIRYCAVIEKDIMIVSHDQHLSSFTLQ